MKRASFAALAMCAVAACCQAQDGGTRTGSLDGTERRAFVSGGEIRFDLSAGDYDFSASPDNTIHISWRWDSGERSRHTSPPMVKAQINVNGRSATVVTDGPHNNIHYTVEVPKSVNLAVRLSAGDISIAEIEGNKDVQIHAGDVRISVGDPQHYSQVDLSVKAGDLNAPPFGGTKDGLFRSFHWTGTGTYQLRVQLDAGDVNLLTGDSI
jgi:Putative adhesin